ncbi:MAG: HD-GYP domain-containing protein [Syntrophomonas sp.]|uniref:HD-GYP domain-containing protein n=1 Tax=Syntrophomonas sp. TaxID=2053627 RepID=UPI00262D641F|nr:HD-GYP domain-containing protein [Syntrophomonas sp.]MDD2510808.1 HD-GYP domain-containing protein [Syntrophomonas sp.]MDD4626414.1 HD-GYP domain-containing protein [Syntrophomonas sp.]
MRRVSIYELDPGMVVAQAIFNSEGRVLLHAGVQLNENYIHGLQKAGIVSVYIRDELFDESDAVNDIISEKIRLKAIKTLKQSFVLMEKQHQLNLHAVKNIVDEIIDEIMQNPNILVNLSDIRSFDDYTYAHSVNVGVLSIMSGINLNYKQSQLKELGIGALLHDIGKIKIDKNILNKPDDLSREEFNEVKRHAKAGFDILRQHSELSLLSAHIAFQHHERWDGQGYPRQLAGEGIHEYARIVAVADVYDALVADRPYRPAYSITQAISILKRMTGLFLDPQCVKAFLYNIAVYPLGSLLELNTGELGTVVDINRKTPAQPVVKVLYDRNWRMIDPYELDLSKISSLQVKSVLSEGQIKKLKML